MLVATPEVDTTAAQKSFDAFVDKAGKGFDGVAGKGNAVVRTLGNIEESAKKAAKAAEKIALKEMVDKAVQGIGALKGVWDGLATSVLGVNDAMAKNISHTIDMTQKGAQLGAVFGPLGGIIGGVGGAILDVAGNLEKFNKEAPEAADHLHKLLTGSKQTEDGFFSLGAAGQGFRQIMEKVQEGVKKLDGGMGDLAPVIQGLDTFFQHMGHSAAFSKQNIDALNQSLKETKTSAQLTGGPASLEELFGAPTPKAPKGGGSTPKKAPGNTTETFTGISREEFLENVKKQNAEADAIFLEGLRRRDQWQQNAAESDYQFELQKQQTLIRIQEEANEEKRAIEEAHQAKMQEIISSGGQLIAAAVKEAAVAGVNAMLDAYANGERRSKEERKRARAERKRDLGTQLMDDGASHVIAGIAGLFSPSPTRKAEASAEIIAGLAEAATGLAWGGIGALQQRRLGGTEAPRSGGSTTPSRGSAEGLGGSGGTQEQRPIVVNFGSTVPMTPRQQQEAWNNIHELERQGRRQG